MRYAPHERFIAPARARSELWRTVVGYLLINAAQIGLIYVAFILAAMALGQGAAQSALQNIFVTATTTRDTLLLLCSFVFLLIGTGVVTAQLHRRSLWSLTGPVPAAVRDFWRVCRALVLLFVVLWVVLPDDTPLVANLTTGHWLALLPVSLGTVLVQTSAEEVLFRGYLQQQLAARFRTPLIWMGGPALLFAWGHYSTAQAGDNAIFAALWAAAFALAASDLTARSGTLGPAIALHFTNNVMALLLVSLPGPVSGLALFTYPFSADSPALLPFLMIDLAVLGVSWLTARLALRV